MESKPAMTGFTGRIRSFKFAFRGLATMLRSQRNAWIHAAATVAVCAASALLGLRGEEWCWIILAITGVWTAEALNTALEFLTDVASPQFHPLAAKALETTSLCEIPFTDLASLSSKLPTLQQQLMRIMSQEIRDDEQNMIVLGQKSAEERLAAFLVSLSSRFRRRGFSPNQFNLSMSRGDIGNYLGLALETVSRLFTRFQNEGLLRVDRKHIELLDLGRLHAYSGLHSGEPLHSEKTSGL